MTSHRKRSEHLAASGISAETAKAHNVRCIHELLHTRDSVFTTILNREWRRAWGESILFPHFDGNDECCYVRIRPDYHGARPDDAPKYLSPQAGPASSRLYFTNGVAESLRGRTAQKIFITEGEKKALCLWQRRYLAISLPGVQMGMKAGSKYHLHPDLQRFDWEGVNVAIVFDSDAKDNAEVSKARERLARALQNAGAVVSIVSIPDGAADPNCPDGSKVGIDDYAVKFGDDALRQLLTDAATQLAAKKEEASSVPPETLAADFLAHLGSPYVHWVGHHVHDQKLGYYEFREESAIHSEAHKWLVANYERARSGISKEICTQLKLSHSLPTGQYPPMWLEDPPDSDFLQLDKCLITKECVIHLPTLKTTPNTEKLFATSVINATYDPAAGDAPQRFLKHLDETLRHEHQIMILQEFAGYSLTSDTSFQKILMLLGAPGAGKGTIIRVLTSLHGREHVASLSLSNLDNQFGLAQLPGKSLLIVNEARIPRGGGALAKERLDSISGEDEITVEQKGIDGKTTRLKLKLILVGNEIVSFQDVANSFGRRLIPLQCYGPEQNQERILNLSEKIFEKESSQILNWEIAGYRRLNAQQKFTPMPEDAPGRELLDIQRVIGSPIKAFLDDECELGIGYTCLAASIYDRWLSWCELNKHRAGTPQRFGGMLKTAAPGVCRKRGPRSVAADSGESYQPSIYTGIALRDRPMGCERLTNADRERVFKYL